MNADIKQTLIRALIAGVIAAAGVLGAAFGLTSCNVTRKVTTESSYFQRGDTTIQIVTRTTESYDASKRF